MPRASAGVRSARLKKYAPGAKTLFGQMNMPEELREKLSFLSTLTSRDDLVALISERYPPGTPEHRLIVHAHDVAQKEMRHLRRHSGERAFRHVYRCFLMLWIYADNKDANCGAAIFLHDLAETFRGKWTFDRLFKEFNFEVAALVMALTKPRQTEGLSKREVERIFYLQQIPGVPERMRRHVVQIKAMDVLDNLLTLWKRSFKRIARKIDDVTRFMHPLLRAHGLNDSRRAIVLVQWEIRRKLRSGAHFAH